MQHYRLHQRLGYRVTRLSRIMQAALEAELAPHNLTRLMWVVLYGIATDRIETPSQLASYLGVTRPSISRVVHKLQAVGLIDRIERDGPDARTVRLVPTEAGRQLVETLQPRVDAHNAHFSGKLTPEELALLMSALERLCAGERDVFPQL